MDILILQFCRYIGKYQKKNYDKKIDEIKINQNLWKY